jgi:hypothetical protein
MANRVIVAVVCSLVVIFGVGKTISYYIEPAQPSPFYLMVYKNSDIFTRALKELLTKRAVYSYFASDYTRPSTQVEIATPLHRTSTVVHSTGSNAVFYCLPLWSGQTA